MPRLVWDVKVTKRLVWLLLPPPSFLLEVRAKSKESVIVLNIFHYGIILKSQIEVKHNWHFHCFAGPKFLLVKQKQAILLKYASALSGLTFNMARATVSRSVIFVAS